MPGMKGIYRINPALLGGIIGIAINMVNIGFVKGTSLTIIMNI